MNENNSPFDKDVLIAIVKGLTEIAIKIIDKAL
jgi:hypothetical protein